MENTENNLSLEISKLQDKINKEKEDRARKCMGDIQKTLNEYSCELIPETAISSKGFKCKINILAK